MAEPTDPLTLDDILGSCLTKVEARLVRLEYAEENKTLRAAVKWAANEAIKRASEWSAIVAERDQRLDRIVEYLRRYGHCVSKECNHIAAIEKIANGTEEQ